MIRKNPETLELIDWFKNNTHKLPTKPFKLHMWTFVENPAEFYEELKREIEIYPNGHHSLQLGGDLYFLREIADPDIC